MGDTCKIADNSDPLRGIFASRPLLTCCVNVPLALLGLEGALGNDWRGKIGEIRRAYFEQHRSIKEIVRTLSVSRAAVRKAA